MNEFEKDPQEKNSDIPYAVSGFLASFIFFTFIFVIGATISFINL
ncbi:MAG TPA: YqzM family protein [Pseudogracilibacillus sp.]|nr:YqzM family protein [Pseudogracilibacillus sp.]